MQPPPPADFIGLPALLAENNESRLDFRFEPQSGQAIAFSPDESWTRASKNAPQSSQSYS